MFKIKLIRFLLTIFLISVSIVLVSCSSPVNAKGDVTNDSGTPVVEERQIPPEATPTPIACSKNTSAVNIQVEPETPNKAQIIISGLEPGEKIIIVYERNLPDTDWRIAKGRTVVELTKPIGDDGTFQDVMSGLNPLEDVFPNEWNVKVVHSKGVTCATFEVPID
ncbi:MAG: hypothetical protein Fur0022_40710 [Anaerolineales bacterium]